METAVEYLIGQGVLGVVLAMVVWYHLKTVKKLEDSAKTRNKAHTAALKAKDEEIKGLNAKIHDIGISAITSIKDLYQAIKD